MFEKSFSVPYYGLDVRERVKPGFLLQFFQEAAALHASSVGIGVEQLLKRDMTWVLRRYRIRIHSYPGKGGITVRTWFEPQRNLLSVRLFDAVDSGGNIIADAWSAWIVVDLKRGRPERLDRALPDAYFRAVDPTGEPVTGDIERVSEYFDLERTFRVRRHELDLNGHTNHTAYFDWAFESTPDEITAKLCPTQLDAEFLVSAKRETVTVHTKKKSDSPARFAYSVILNDTGDEAARLAATWTNI
jgi:acyl-ACP thioesterase